MGSTLALQRVASRILTSPPSGPSGPTTRLLLHDAAVRPLEDWRIAPAFRAANHRRAQAKCRRSRRCWGARSTFTTLSAEVGCGFLAARRGLAAGAVAIAFQRADLGMVNDVSAG